MNKRFLKGGTPKVPQSKYNRNSAQGYSGESNCPTRAPYFQQEKQGEVEGRVETRPSLRPQACISWWSGSPTAHPHPPAPTIGGIGRYLQWFEPFQSGVRSGVE